LNSPARTSSAEPPHKLAITQTAKHGFDQHVKFETSSNRFEVPGVTLTYRIVRKRGRIRLYITRINGKDTGANKHADQIEQVVATAFQTRGILIPPAWRIL